MNTVVLMFGSLLAGLGGLVLTQIDSATAHDRDQILWAWWFSFLTFVYVIVDAAVLLWIIGLMGV